MGGPMTFILAEVARGMHIGVESVAVVQSGRAVPRSVLWRRRGAPSPVAVATTVNIRIWEIKLIPKN